METIEYRTIDKASWPRGAWDNEPDKVQWQDDATGLPCLIVRGPSGALCGYVGVPDGHPWHGLDYNEVYDACETAGIEAPYAHGGLTYSDHCQPSTDEGSGICHKPGPGEPDHAWWLGFDCAHSGDVCPGRSHASVFINRRVEAYRDLDYVRGCVADLAALAATVPR